METGINSYHPFTEVGFTDPLVASEIFKQLNIGEYHFKNAMEFNKLMEVAKFFNDYSNSPAIVNNVLRRKPNNDIKPLDHVWSFVQLHKRRSEILENLKNVEGEIALYE